MKLPKLTDELIEAGVDLSDHMKNALAVSAATAPFKVNVDFSIAVAATADRCAEPANAQRFGK